MFKIEKGIEIPEKKKGKESRWKIILEMEIGDSFFIPKTAVPTRNGLYGRFRHYAEKANIKLSVRSVEGGYRVWRIE